MMDMLLKERLVGAVVLVLAAVIFIPVVLDGPDSAALVSQRVALPAPADADDQRTVRIALDAQEPRIDAVVPQEPATVDLTPAQSIENNGTASADPPREAPAETAGAQPVSNASAEETGAIVLAPWTVQVGSFSQDRNAEALAARLRELGYPAYVSRHEDGAQVHHRVRVGSFPSREAAQSEADAIHASTGQPARPARNR